MAHLHAIGPLITRQTRSHRGILVTVLLLTILAGALGNLGLIFGVKYPNDLAARLDELGTEHVNVAVNDEEARDRAVALLNDDSRVDSVAVQPTRIAWSTLDYNGAENTVALAFVDQDATTPLGQSQVVEEYDQPVENPVYVPLMLNTGGNYALGDPVTVSYGGNGATFHIQGFTENGFGGAMSMSTLVFGLPSAEYEDFAASPEAPPAGWFVRARVADTDDATDVLTELNKALSEMTAAKGRDVVANWPLEWNLVVSVMSIGAAIYAALLVGFALLLAAIAVLVVSVTLRNAILGDIVAIGVQRALGYSTAHIAASILIPVAGASFVGSLMGVGLSYLPLPALAAGLVAQAGLTWEPGFSWVGLAVVPVAVAVCVLAVAATTRSIRRVSAVTALRGGQESHSFQPTVLPLATTPGPLAVVMGLKQSARNIGQNLSVAAVILVATFASVLGVTLYTGLVSDDEAFSTTTVGRMQDLSVYAPGDADVTELRQRLADLDGVAGAFITGVEEGQVGDTGVAVTVAEDFSQLPPPSIIYEGRDPQFDNEIALGGKLAGQLGVSVGDTVTFDVGSHSRELLVTGLTQSTQRLGMTAEVTTGAFTETVPGYSPSMIGLWLDDGADTATVARAAERLDGVTQVERLKEGVSSQLDVYQTMVKGLAIGILGLTALFVALVTALAAVTAVSRGRHGMGISKALGFSDAQLIGQLVVSSLPVAVCGVAFGALLGIVGVNPVLLAMLRQAGIMKLDLAADPAVVTVVCLGVLAMSVAMTWLAALRVRGISAYKLLTG